MRDIGNSKDVLRKAAEDRLKPKPKPVIERRGVKSSRELHDDFLVIDGNLLSLDSKQKLLDEIDVEESKVRVERNTLSSQIWKMVANGAPANLLAAHYEKIESYRPTLIEIYDRRRYVEQHGNLPERPSESHEVSTPLSLLELKDRKRKLSDQRCKLKKKLLPNAKPSSAEQLQEWNIQLCAADVEYFDIEERIKNMQLK